MASKRAIGEGPSAKLRSPRSATNGRQDVPISSWKANSGDRFNAVTEERLLYLALSVKERLSMPTLWSYTFDFSDNDMMTRISKHHIKPCRTGRLM